MEFSIASYNLALSIGPPLVLNGAHDRAERVADAFYTNVKNVDVIMLQELIVHREKVLNSFIFHPHRTQKVQSNLFSSNIRFLSSGLAILSRWPIVKERSLVFDGETYHLEKIMSKAVLYAKLKTPAGFVHTFNSHTNAWCSPKAVLARESQAQQIGAFIKSMDIPTCEPVFFGGDLNFDIYEHGTVAEHISDLVGGIIFHKPKEVAFSSDPLLNVLVGTDDASEYRTRSRRNGCYEEFMQHNICLCCPRQLLDLIGTMSQHHQPSNLEFSVIPVKARTAFPVHMNLTRIKLITDVSDHFPVLLRMTLEAELSENAEEEEVGVLDYLPATVPNLGWSLTIIVFALAYFIILLTFVVGVYHLFKFFLSYGHPKHSRK
jgi:endonuclease/exonuclease/phosphatase family metal-dependent hydrolase